ncbi:MAG: penicillin-binding protein 2 [Candidatus Omnitrophota bacterium]
MRPKVIGFVVILGFAFLLLNLLNFQVIRGREFRRLSDKNCIRILAQDGSRGRILDRNGLVLVTSEISYDLMIFAKSFDNLDSCFWAAAKILETDSKILKTRFKNGYLGAFAPVAVAKNLTLKQAIALEELKMSYPQITVQPHPVRLYTYGRLAAHIIGYLNEIDRWRLTRLEDYGYNTKDIVGFGGVEENYDYYLRQEEGGLSVEVDHRARPVRTLGFKPPKNGKDIELTLDLKIQKIIEEALQGQRGCVVVMQPQTGEILGLASFPNFNPSVFVKRDIPAIRELFRNPEAPLVNRAISSAFPAGSVFKVVVAAAGLETGRLSAAKTFYCSGAMRIGRAEFACWEKHDAQNLVNAMAHSCNIFFYNTGLLAGAKTLHDYAVKFGFAHACGIDLPYETTGFIPSPLWRKVSRMKNWFDGDTANLAIGQGEVLVSPLQIARMMAVFANNGYLVRPYIVKAVDGRDISLYQRKAVRLPIKEATLNYVREGLRGVIAFSDGTASILSVLPISAAGKTGTAQAPPGLSHGWFAGFFPFKNPKFVICVFLERGGAGYYASIVAKQIIERMIQEGLV